MEYNVIACLHSPSRRTDHNPLTETPLHETHTVESVSPSLNLGAIGAPRSTWLGPAWAALCGLIASSAFTFDGPSLLIALFAFLLVDWVWPAVWTTCVRTDWLASLERWRATPTPLRHGRWPYFQLDSPGDRLLGWSARLSVWRRSSLAPMAGASLVSLLVALIIGLALSFAIGWRALALSLAALALTGVGTLRSLRTALDSDGLRSMVYGTLPWWLGHAAFAPLSVASAGAGLLFGMAYWAMMGSGQDAPSPAALAAPQILMALAVFGGGQPAAAFVMALAISAQLALRTFLIEHPFARRAQVWLMVAMLAAAIAIA